MITEIIATRPDSPDAVQLITELEAVLAPQYPATSRHGYSVDKLIREGVAFFVMYHDGAPAGCGGVQFFANEYGELKRMFVRPQFRGLGLAKRLITYLSEYSLQSNIPVLRLETGIHQIEAIALYEKSGFQRIPAFGAYKEDPLSIFFEKRLE